MAKLKTVEALPRPELTADGNPFLANIRREARRLPGGYLVASGHVADVLGAPAGSTELVDRLAAFCDHEGLEAHPDANDGIRFTVRPSPAKVPTAAE